MKRDFIFVGPGSAASENFLLSNFGQRKGWRVGVVRALVEEGLDLRLLWGVGNVEVGGEFGGALVDVVLAEVEIGEGEVGGGKVVLGTAKGLGGFGRELIFGDEDAGEKIARWRMGRIEIENVAGGGFGFGVTAHGEEHYGLIVERLDGRGNNV